MWPFLNAMAMAVTPYRIISGSSEMHVDHNSEGVLGDTWLSYGKVTGFNVLTIQDVEYELKSFDAFTIPKGTMHGVVGNGFREYKAIDSVTGLGVGCAACYTLGTYYAGKDVNDSDICINCVSGTYQDDNPSDCFVDPCKSCGSGTYQDEEGQSQCKMKPHKDDSSDDLSPGAVAFVAAGSVIIFFVVSHFFYRMCSSRKQ